MEVKKVGGTDVGMGLQWVAEKVFGTDAKKVEEMEVLMEVKWVGKTAVGMGLQWVKSTGFGMEI